jgi:hypothetical protein
MNKEANGIAILENHNASQKIVKKVKSIYIVWNEGYNKCTIGRTRSYKLWKNQKLF